MRTITYWYFIIIILTIPVIGISQVTIGSANKPEKFTILQLDGTTGGLRLNQLTTLQRDALLVVGNNLAIGLMIYNLDQKQIEIWNGTEWVSLSGGSGGGETFAANGLTKYADSIHLGGTLDRSTNIDLKNHLLTFTNSTTPIMSVATANIGIGTASPAPNAILDISATNKGVLLPRVSLVSNTDQVTIPLPSRGMLIYNTGANIAYPFEGYLYWNGAEWRSIDGSEAIVPKIVKTQCFALSTLEPAILTAGEPYVGVMKVPYEGGNGGKYPAGAVIAPIASSLNKGLTAQLRAGTLAYGNGYLVYDVTGTPTASSPTGVRFLIDFGGAPLCVNTVGNVELETATVTSWATMGPLLATSDNDAAGFHRVATTPDGKFSVRVFVPTGTILGNADLQIRSNVSAVNIMWNGHVSYQGGTIGTASNALALLSANMWYGTNGVNSNTAVSVASTINAAWGDPDVYYLAPEQRSYMWTSTTVTDRTMYVLKFMMGAPSYSLAASASTASQTKAYLEIQQITTPK